MERAREAGDTQGAIALLLPHVKEAPDDARGWNELGALLHSTGDHERAIECLKRALQAAPHDPVAMENLVLACVSAGRNAEAALLATRWSESEPDNAQAWSLLGRLHLMAGQPDEARQCLRRALSLAPEDAVSKQAMGALVAAGHGPDAAERDDTPLPFLGPLKSDAPPATADPGIVWVGAQLGLSSYSIHSRQSIVWLRQAGVRVQAVSIGRSADAYLASLPVDELRRLKDAISERVEDGVFVMHHAPATISEPDVYRSFVWRHPKQLAYAALTAFETEGIPAHWVKPLNRMDQVWVQTEFNRRTFTEAGVHPSKIRVVGAGLDMKLYDPDQIEPRPVLRKRSFVFLSIFQWHSRKGWPILIEGFAQSFGQADDVCLIIKAMPSPGDRVPIEEQINAFLASKGLKRELAAPIIVIDRDMSDADIRALYRSADAFVLPTRGEGWGIPFHEAMAMGLPTLATRYSGHLDYMNDSNSFLINVRGLADVDEAMLAFNPEYAGLRYAEPDMDHMIHLMRHVVENRAAAAAVGAKARQDIMARWTAEHYVERLRLCTRELAGRAEGRRAPPPPVAEPRRDLLPVVMHGPALDPSGYAHDFRNLLLGLAAGGADVTLNHQSWNQRFGLVNTADAAWAVNLMTPEPPKRAHIAIENPLVPPAASTPGALRTIRIFWETDRLPAEKAARCVACDQVWVASTCNAEAARRAGVPEEKIRIVPVALDVENYGPHVEPLAWRDADRFTFLACFDLTLRKGWDLLLRAFLEEFSPEDAVRLVLNVHSSGGSDRSALRDLVDQWGRRWAGERWLTPEGRWRAPAPILCLEEDLHEDDMPRFFRSGDAFVMPSRGEGWGIPAMQAMASGVPVIATAWGGQTDYLDDDVGWLLPYRVRPVNADACREVPAFAGQMWAEPDYESLRQTLRQVRQSPHETRRRAEAGMLRVRERYSRDKIDARAVECLSELRPSRNGASLGDAPRVLWQGPLMARSSLALVNRELCARLSERAGCRLSPVPLDGAPEPRVCRPALRRRVESIPQARRDASCDVLVRHFWPPDFSRPANARKLVVMQPWEFGRIPEKWIDPIRRNVDEIWVYSRHVFESYVDAGVPPEKVWLTPLGVDQELFTPEGPALPLKTARSFRFLFVGGTIWRKGIDVLLRAYEAAFKASDDVCLVIKDMGMNSFYKGQCATERIREFQSRAGTPEILYLTEDMGEEDIARLYRACHCLVHPYRGEGFGLPVAEAAASGLPVIVTRGGATDDFIPASLGYFIPSRPVGVRLDEFNLNGWVLEPDAQALAELMARVRSRAEERRERAGRMRNAVSRLSWEAAALAVELRIRALTRRTAPKSAPLPEPA